MKHSALNINIIHRYSILEGLVLLGIGAAAGILIQNARSEKEKDIPEEKKKEDKKGTILSFADGKVKLKF